MSAAETDPERERAKRIVDGGFIDLGSGGSSVLPPDKRYEIGEPLGAGGMGEIYRAYDRELRREVAVKIVHQRFTGEAELLARLREEAQVEAQLEHPNIARTYDIGVDAQRRLFFVMHLIRGRSLAQVLKDSTSRPSPVRLLQIFVEICNAVSYAHSRGVLHRDLKPDNVMLGDHGEVFVLDWGLAKVLGEASAGAVETDRSEQLGAGALTGQARGTPIYMAPEQARDEPPDPRTDVFTLGAILFELMTLRKPCLGETRGEIETRRARGEFPAVPAAVPRELRGVIERATNADKEARYGSVDELRGDVQAYLEGRPGSAWSDSLLRRALKWARRNRAVASVGAVGLVVALVLGIAQVVTIVEARRAEDRAQRAREMLREAWQLRDDMLFLLREGHREKAFSVHSEIEQIAERASAIDPTLPDVEFALAVSQRLLGNRSKARAHLNRALSKDPEFGPALLHRGLLSAEEYDDGLAAALLLWQARPVVGTGLAIPVPQSSGSTEELEELDPSLQTLRRAAEADLTRGIGKSSSREDERLGRAMLHIAREEYREAILALGDSEREEAYLIRSRAHFSEGRLNVAEELAQRAVEINRSYIDGYSGLANARNEIAAELIRKGHLEEGIATYHESVAAWDEVLARAPDRAEALALRGGAKGELAKCLAWAGKDSSKIFAESIEDYTRARELDPDSVLAATNLAAGYLWIGAAITFPNGDPSSYFEKAVECATDALDRGIKHPFLLSARAGANYGLAEWAQSQGRDARQYWEQYLADCERLLLFDATRSTAHLGIGLASIKIDPKYRPPDEDPIDRLAAAEGHLDQITEADPLYPLSLIHKAEIHIEMAQREAPGSEAPSPHWQNAIDLCDEVAKLSLSQYASSALSVRGNAFMDRAIWLDERNDPAAAGEIRAAIAAYERVTQEGSLSGHYYANRANAFALLARLLAPTDIPGSASAAETAIGSSKKAIRLNPNNPLPHVVYAQAIPFVLAGQVEETLQSLPRQDRKSAAESFKQLYENVDDSIDRGIAHCDTAIRLKPEDGNNYATRALLNVNWVGWFGPFAEDLDGPEGDEIQEKCRARLLDALEDCKTGRRLDPGSLPIFAAEARVLRKLGRVREAIDVTRQGLVAHPKSPRLMNLLAELETLQPDEEF